LKARIGGIKTEMSRVNSYFHKKKANQESYDQTAKNLDMIRQRTYQQRVVTQKDIEVGKKEVASNEKAWFTATAECQKLSKQVMSEQDKIAILKRQVQQLNLQNSKMQEEKECVIQAKIQSEKQRRHL